MLFSKNVRRNEKAREQTRFTKVTKGSEISFCAFIRMQKYPKGFNNIHKM